MSEPTDSVQPDESSMDPAESSLHPDESDTGVDPDVAAALDALAARPLAEHAEVYTQLHERLQRTLAEIDGG